MCCHCIIGQGITLFALVLIFHVAFYFCCRWKPKTYPHHCNGRTFLEFSQPCRLHRIQSLLQHEVYSERKTGCRREHILQGNFFLAFFLSAFVAIHTSYVKRSVILNHTPLRICFEKEFSAGCQPRYPIKIPITGLSNYFHMSLFQYPQNKPPALWTSFLILIG